MVSALYKSVHADPFTWKLQWTGKCMLTLSSGNCTEFGWHRKCPNLFLLMEDGHKVVLFYISNALIQDIPFWPLFVLATAAQQQEGKNWHHKCNIIYFSSIRFAGKAWIASRTWTHDIIRETLSFHHHVSWHCYPDLSKKCLAHLWCHPHFVHASAAEGIFRVYLTCLITEFWQELLLQRSWCVHILLDVHACQAKAD